MYRQRLENGSRTWRFKRKIELGCVFDSVKKLHADVLRQNITNAGGPEASRYLLDLCAPLSSWAGPVKNKTRPEQSIAQLKLARPEKTIYVLNKCEDSASTN